jgi:hypothetical protein
MRVLLIASLLVLTGCAGPGTVTAIRTSDGVALRFAAGNKPGIELNFIEVFEVEGGVRGRTVCDVSSGSKVIEWVYGSEIRGNEDGHGQCEKLASNHVYGVLGWRFDRRVVVTRFTIDEDGSIHDLGRRE